MVANNEPLWDRTLRRIREIWPLGDPAELKDTVSCDLAESDLDKIRQKIDACLKGRGGEVSARARAAELGKTYSVLTATGRRRFLELLAEEYDVDNEAVEAAITYRRSTQDPAERQRATEKLRRLLEPPRTQLLRQFNDLPEGVKFLVDLRAELIVWAREHPKLAALDQDIFRLLASWFDVGFLELQQITWKTSAHVLEKLIAYEAVHEIRSWQDLKNRLEDDRRCYAFFHPSMPDEPLIFVEVALVDGISTTIHALLDEKAPPGDPSEADTAIFYSISNCQAGLAGVSFGNFLIKRVVADLVSGLPDLKTFSTLSPIPGFVDWLRKNSPELDLDEAEAEAVSLLTAENFDVEDFRRLIQPASDDSEAEPDKQRQHHLQQTLLALCAHYLLMAKRRGKQAFDRVAHFHLTNGAQVKQLNWAADISAKGILQSASLMVNYLYDLDQIEKNHEVYSSYGEIAASGGVRKMAKKVRLQPAEN